VNLLVDCAFFVDNTTKGGLFSKFFKSVLTASFSLIIITMQKWSTKCYLLTLLIVNNSTE